MRCIPLLYHPHMSPPPLGNCARRRIGWAWQPEDTVARTLWRLSCIFALLALKGVVPAPSTHTLL